MKKVILDIGNTRIKCAIFQENQLEELKFFMADDYSDCQKYLETITAKRCIISTTQQDNLSFLDFLQRKFDTINFTTATPLPIDIAYKTPHTLGDDRKAAVCGAVAQLGQIPILVITAGTCITYNYFDGHSFLGGGISPGVQMRYQAMHEFTGKLPLAQNENFDDLVGQTTHQSLQSGVRQGILAEISGIIEQYRLLHNNLAVFICGGDTNFFESRLKSEIFASPNLVLFGLNHILEFNK